MEKRSRGIIIIWELFLNDEKLRYFKQYQELFGNEVFRSIGH